MEQPFTNAEYSDLVNKKSPNSPMARNMFWAFIVGGIICIIGQFITNYFLSQGVARETVASITPVILILFSVTLTALNIYNKIGKFAGAGSIVPITMGSNTLCQGTYALVDDIVKYLPSPENKEVAGINMNTKEIFQANYDFAKAKSAYVFKTIVDPFIGKYSLIKVCSGVFKSDDVIYNNDKDIEEKVSKLYVLQGSKAIEVPELHAGDIGAIAKLTAARTGNSLSIKTNTIVYGKFELSKPYTYMRYKVPNKNDIDKVAQALQKLGHEDQTLKVVNDV